MVSLLCRGPLSASCCLADSQDDLGTCSAGCLGRLGVVRDCQLGREVLMDRLANEEALCNWLASWPLMVGVAYSRDCFSKSPMTTTHCHHQDLGCACIHLSIHPLLWLPKHPIQSSVVFEIL
jgi:hypothetical protein